MEKFREFEVNNRQANVKKRFKSNIVHTNKFNPFNFVPFFIWNQLQKSSNVFFIFCAIIEQMGDYLPKGMLPSFIPLILVWAFSAIKDIVEEIVRLNDNEYLLTIFRIVAFPIIQSITLKHGFSKMEPLLRVSGLMSRLEILSGSPLTNLSQRT